MPGAHAQTIWPARFARRREAPLERQTWDTPDGDFIDLDFLAGKPGECSAPLWVIFHGLEGSSRSHYARALIHHASELGHHAVVPHFRGCSGRPNRLPRAYHSGDSGEIDWIVRRLAREHPDRPLFAIGVSLGGNALLKWLGERGRQACLVTAAAAICPPQSLRAGAVSLSKGFNRIYAEYFLRTLRPKSLALAERFPGLIDTERVIRSRDFFEFDDAVTAPLHGFDGCEDYWARSSCQPFLAAITVPTLVINTLNDPFLPPRHLAPSQAVSASVSLEYPAAGGHVGFPQAGEWGAFGWVPQRLARFLAEQMGSRLSRP